MEHTVLFVDDEPMVTDALKRALRKEPYRILSANSAEAAFALLAGESVDVVVSDEKMPGISGTDFLAIVRREYPDTVRMMLTGHATLDVAVRAINDGQIYRFFAKPCNEADLAVTIRQALQQKDLMKEAWRLLQVARYQSSVIDKMKQEHPELVRIDRDKDGAVILSDTHLDTDLDKLIGEINEHTKSRLGS